MKPSLDFSEYLENHCKFVSLYEVNKEYFHFTEFKLSTGGCVYTVKTMDENDDTNFIINFSEKKRAERMVEKLNSCVNDILKKEI
jgi:hypothetical protein